MRALTDLIIKFKTDNSGAIAIMFGLVFILLVAVVGGAVDYGQWTSARSTTQKAIDAAVLAGGRILQLPNTTQAQAIATAQQYYDQHKSNVVENDDTTFAIGSNDTEIAAVSVTSIVKTPFLSIIGIPSLPVEMTATAKLAAGANSGSDVEISMMLDITGSMEGTKITDLKIASKDLIDIVVWTDQSEYTSRVAIAPFSEYVNVGTTYFNAVTGQTAASDNFACVMERDTSHRYTDHKPNGGDYFDAYSSGTPCQTTATILPLTSDKTALHSHIDSLTTDGHTAGHLGTGWAWYLLSPKWDSIWPVASEPKAYDLTTQLNPVGNPKLYKIAILMTDGVYNQEYTGDSATNQARTICTNMKAEGVTVYTVGFDITVGSDPDVTMQQCATLADHYYNAADGAELKSAFRDIALKILTLRLSN